MVTKKVVPAEDTSQYPIVALVGAVMGRKYIWRHAILVYFMWKFYEKSTTTLYICCAVSFYWRLFSCHAFGHRYFCHKSFEVGRVLEYIMAITIASTDLCNMHYWCLMHEVHHLRCDEVEDIHSPYHIGFWGAQFGNHPDAKGLFVRLCPYEKFIKIFSFKYKNNYAWMLPYNNLLLILGESILLVIIGHYLQMELWFWVNFFPRMCVLNAMTLTNSAGHYFGTRPFVGNNRPPLGHCYATNCWWAALLNGGEGWHNNHHAFAKSAKHGLLWWEIDWVWYGLCVLGNLGLIWNVQVVF